MPSNECLNCGATAEYDVSGGQAVGEQQLKTTITCPECHARHRRFESGQWTRLVEPDDERPE